MAEGKIPLSTDDGLPSYNNSVSSSKRKRYIAFVEQNGYNDLKFTSFDKEFTKTLNQWYQSKFKDITKCATKPSGCYTVLMNNARKDKNMGKEWRVVIMQYMLDNNWEFINSEINIFGDHATTYNSFIIMFQKDSQ